MKVAHIIDSGGYYGAEIMLANLCIEQIKSGISVLVISIGKAKEKIKPLEAKLKEFGIPYIRWNMMPLPDVRQSLAIVNYCLEQKVDVLHSHGYKGNILLGLIPKAKRKLPAITTVHGYTEHKLLSKMTLYQLLDKICVQRLDAVVLVSPSMKHQVPTTKIEHMLHVVENGLPATEALHDDSSYKSHFSESSLKIGSLGRLSYEKNFSLLLDAFSIVVKQLPTARLVVYGEGSEREKLEKKIQMLGLDKKATFPGFLSGTTKFLQDIDVFVNCSFTEGMPISILESMRSGCPIIATNIPANKTLLESLNTPDQLCDLNADSLARCLIRFANMDSQALVMLRQRSMEIFRKKYTVEIMCQKYQSIYESVLKNE